MTTPTPPRDVLEATTREEWIDRFVALFKERTGMGARTARDYAECAFEAEPDLSVLPEDAVSGELSEWHE